MIIRLACCPCERCRGRATVCTNAFKWMGKHSADHVGDHAKLDLLTYFEHLPANVKDALNGADVNVCSYCAEIWVGIYGAARAVQLIANTRFIPGSDTVAITGLMKEGNGR